MKTTVLKLMVTGTKDEEAPIPEKKNTTPSSSDSRSASDINSDINSNSNSNTNTTSDSSKSLASDDIMVPNTGYISDGSITDISMGGADGGGVVVLMASIIVAVVCVVALIARFKRRSRIGFSTLSRRVSIGINALLGVMMVLALCGIGRTIAALSNEANATVFDGFSVDDVVEVKLQLDKKNSVEACGNSNIIIEEGLSSGYEITMQAGKLQLTSGGSTEIPSITEAGRLKMNSWGYKMKAATSMIPVPTSTTSIKNVETAVQSGDTTDVEFCVMLGPDAEIGTYEANIVYNVEPHAPQPEPTPTPTDDGKNPIVTVDGNRYMFPLAFASKDNYLHGIDEESVLSPMPCTGGCHHDYVALDMGLRKQKIDGQEKTNADYPDLNYDDFYYYSDGVKVLAFVEGEIVYNSYYTNGVPDGYGDRCGQIMYQGIDGNSYWIGHLAYNDSIKAGDRFELGDVIGEVGPPPCAQGTQSHVHIHISPSSSNNTQIYTIMNAAYEALPDVRPSINTNSTSNTNTNNAEQNTTTNDQPIEPLQASSVDVPCDSRTIDRGIAEGYSNGEKVMVRLCAIPNMEDVDGSPLDNNYVVVNSRVSGAFYALNEAHKTRYGNYLAGSEGFRTNEEQEYFYNCYLTQSCNGGNVAAAPGYSDHQMGLAIDFLASGFYNGNTNLCEWVNGSCHLGSSFLSEFGLSDGRSFGENWHIRAI